MPYQLLYSSKISLLLLFSASDGEMGPCHPNPFPECSLKLNLLLIQLLHSQLHPVLQALIPCLIAFLENRITLSKAKRIQAHT